MRIKLASLIVDDQEKALRFYTEVLGFVKKHDVMVGESRWVTIVSPEGPDDIELALEPNANPVGKVYQQGLYESGIPQTAFATDDIQRDYERLKALGVQFRSEPAPAGPVTIALFDDTCGNLIQLYQV